MDIRTHIDDNGRLLIPSEIRKKFDLKNGSAVVIRVIDNEVKLINISQMLNEAQNIMRKYVPEGTDLVAELKSMREQDARHEADASSFHNRSGKKEGHK